MPDANARGWGDPDAPNYRTRNITKVTAGGVTLYVRREVAHLFKGFCDEIVARGYRLDVNADDWGYNNRDIRGRPGIKSNHAWGLAIDINSTHNPMTSDGRVHTDMPPWIREVAHAWGLFWGADYTGNRKDPMHFEFLGRPSDVRKDRNPPLARPNPKPAPEEENDDMPDYIVEVIDDASPVFYWVSPNGWTVISDELELKLLQKNAKTVQLTQFEFDMRRHNRQHNPR